MSKITKREKDFADELSRYENRWVAIERTGSKEKVVASGNGFKEAKLQADKVGAKDPVFLKVPSKTKILIA